MAAKQHLASVCERSALPIDTQYVGRGYKAKFRCAECGRTVWQLLSYLYGRVLVCNGVKLTKVPREEVR